MVMSNVGRKKQFQATASKYLYKTYKCVIVCGRRYIKYCAQWRASVTEDGNKYETSAPELTGFLPLDNKKDGGACSTQEEEESSSVSYWLAVCLLTGRTPTVTSN